MRLLITQRKSAIGRSLDQKATIQALGLNRLHQQVIHQDSPQILGMLTKVQHLIEVEEIKE